MTTNEYICRYLTAPGRPAEATYTAASIEEAVAMHVAALPQYRLAVLDWKGPRGLLGISSIPPQPVTVFDLTSGPVRIRMSTGTERITVPPGHELELRYFAARDGSGVEVRWHAMDGEVTEVRESTDLFGLHHWDTIGHNPFTCDDCPAMKTWT